MLEAGRLVLHAGEQHWVTPLPVVTWNALQGKEFEDRKLKVRFGQAMQGSDEFRNHVAKGGSAYS